MKNQDWFRKLGDFALGKGFYIVLFLCVATIGISGYYLIRSLTGQPEANQPAGGDASVVLPDDPDPIITPITQEDPEEDDDPPPDVSQPDDADSPAALQQPQTETPVSAPPAPEDAPYTWPVRGSILRGFSTETLSPDPTLGDWRTHAGLDIAAALGDEVLAISAGTVSRVYDDGLMGTTVVVDHGNGLVSTYCGLSASPPVEEGQAVETGEVIGAVGDTAIAESGMAPHLHLETALEGAPADPADYLPQL